MLKQCNGLREQVKYAAEKIQCADAVLIGIQNLFQGFYYVYSSPEQQWGFYSRYIQFMYDMPVGKPYTDLKAMLKGKGYFIERLFQFQGDFRYFQCCQPCHDRLYGNWGGMINAILSHMEHLQVPETYLPRCPECGWRISE